MTASRRVLEKVSARPKPIHPYEWLWEPLARAPTFLIKPMFGGRAAYLRGRLVLYFTAKREPWRGLLVATEREHHAALRAEFPVLAPHRILPKWLYLPEANDNFERTAVALVRLAARHDPRIGIAPRAKRKASPRRRGL